MCVQYQWTNKEFPKGLIICRSSGNDGQFDGFVEKEVGAVQKALQIDEFPPISITYVIAQHNHGVCVVPEGYDSKGRSKNVPSGTVCDATALFADVSISRSSNERPKEFMLTAQRYVSIRLLCLFSILVRFFI